MPTWQNSFQERRLQGMFGYVREYAPELKIKHHVLYRAVYCGLCKSMGRCTGFCSRMTLSYDGVFLALVRMALEKTKGKIQRERCFLHLLKKHPIMEPIPALDYSARVSALLFYTKVCDDLSDRKGVSKLLVTSVYPLAAHWKKKAGLDDLYRQLQTHLNALSELEQSRCESVDKTADCFGAVCAEFLSFGLSGEQAAIARSMGRHVGRWIYVADALDDWEKDAKSGVYNPLLAVYGKDVSEKERTAICDTMKNELAAIGKALDLITFADDDIRELIYHIVFEGMHRTAEALAHKKQKKEKRIEFQ